MSRRAFPLPTFLLFICIGIALLAACGQFQDEDEGEVALTEVPLERRGTISVRKGYIDGKPVEFYRMSTFVPASTSWFPSYDTFPGMPVKEMYIWTDGNGNPSLGQSQLPIIDTLPLQANTSDFFEIVAVTPTEEYSANDIKSRGTLLRAGTFDLKHTGKIVNCPVVTAGTKLAGTGGQPLSTPRLLKLWYRKKTTYCLLMDGGAHLYPDGGGKPFAVFSTDRSDGSFEHRVPAAEVYTMQSRAYGGEDRISNIPVPDNDIFIHDPNGPSYSPLVKIWDVSVPSDYKVGQLTSHADLFPIPDFTDPRIEERSPEAFCNCPIVRLGK